MKKLAIILLDWNGADDTIECLSTLRNSELYDIFLLDNGSLPENTEKLKGSVLSSEFTKDSKICSTQDFDQHPAFLNYIRSDVNLGFAGGNNMIANRICDQYQYLLLLNNDTFVTENAIEHMVDSACAYHTTALTCDIRIYYRRNELWNAGGEFTWLGERKYFSQKKIDLLKEKNVDHIDAGFITGCALLIEGEYVAQNGLFTEDFFHGEEDFNLCYHLARNHKKVGVDLQAVIYHKVGQSIQRMDMDKRIYSGMLVNYSNRVIDFKHFYPRTKWLLWRCLYLAILSIRRITTGMSVRDTFLLCKRVRIVSDRYDNVKKPVFDELMNYTW